MTHRNARRGLSLPAALMATAAAGPMALAAGLCGIVEVGAGAMTLALVGTTASAALLGAGWIRTQGTARRSGAELDRLRRRIHADPLTGLMNRAAFHAALEALDRDQDGGMVAVLFFDLDRFKEVNDTLGHKAGDDLLVQIAGRALDALPATAQIARLGGDEFAAIIPWQFTDAAEAFGDCILRAVAQPFALGQQQVQVGASVGIALGVAGAVGGAELLRRADIAMYAAKGSNRMKCRVFDEVLDTYEIHESSVRVEVGKAMIDNQLQLLFQPLVDARSGLFDSAEGLLRAQSPALRDVAPTALIATVEASGQIHALTDWTIETALEAIIRLETAPIAVNISPVYFRQPEFVHKLFDKLLLAQVSPELLVLEVTEGVLIDNLDSARQSLARLREVGIKVHLDDFGTGYSSLSYLQHFDLDGLKLDKSFLQSIGDKRKTNRIIRSMIDFGHSLDLRVIVEGIESEWQARLLQLLDADVLQGFEIGLPMVLDDLVCFRNRHARVPWLPTVGDNADSRRMTAGA